MQTQVPAHIDYIFVNTIPQVDPLQTASHRSAIECVRVLETDLHENVQQHGVLIATLIGTGKCVGATTQSRKSGRKSSYKEVITKDYTLRSRTVARSPYTRARVCVA